MISFSSCNSAFINKCIERGNEDHCEPMLEHVQGLDKQTLFEAYVNSFPVKWNLHFFPQSVYCNGLSTFGFLWLCWENGSNLLSWFGAFG
jgi:hypothetical protein